VTISGRTEVVGIIGDPVSHSRSPAIHNAAFAALGLDMVYVPLRVSAADLPAAAAGLRALGMRGANVTIPHKGGMVPLVDHLDADARVADAVNTIVVTDGVLRGYNTDIAGVRDAVQHAAAGEPLGGAAALILGAGGAARAAAVALARLGMEITIVNRTEARARHLEELLAAGVPGARCRRLAPADVSPADVARHKLLVNASSLGMTGVGKVPPWMADNVTAEQIVFDLVYTETETDLIVRARERGARAIDGLEMLVRQAAVSFELWTGRQAPLKVMQDAVK
jgi:shikimate dehydrogenase